MYSNTVLIVSERKNNSLSQAISNVGYSPLFQKNMNGALDKLRREKFAAILVDIKRVDIDVLEFVLNVRDFDEQTPVIFIGRLPEKNNEATLLTLNNSFLIPSYRNSEELTEKLKRIIKVRITG